jgi:hypothetical protein
MRTVVFQGPAEPIREAHVGANEAAAMCDAWCERAQGTRVGRLRRALRALCEPEFALELGVRGGVRGLAGGEGRAIPRQHEGSAGQEPQEVVLAPRRDEGTVVACTTAGQRLSRKPRAPGAHPRREGVWRVCQDVALACRGARRLPADLGCGLSPVEADERRPGLRRSRCQVSPPAGEARMGGRAGELTRCDGMLGSRWRGSP